MVAQVAVKRYRYFGRVDFILACRNSVKRGYNRQIALTPNEEFNLPDRLYVVLLAVPHEHIAGEPAPMHMRVVVGLCEKGGSAILDVDLDVFESLPEIEVPA